MQAKRAKRFLRFLAWLVVIVIILAVSVPLWFPWVLRPVAKRLGASFLTYERVSYSRFAVTGVSYTNRTVHVQAKRLEVSPWSGHVKAADWSVEIAKGSSGPSTNTPASVYAVYQKVSRIISKVQEWVPEAALTDGYVQTAKVAIHLPDVRWKGPDLHGEVQISNALPQTIVQAKLPATGTIDLDLATSALELKSTLIISNTANGLFIQGSNQWRSNAFSLNVAFGTQGALPETARLMAPSVTFPPVQGAVSIVWEHDRYVLNAQGQEPVTFKLQATGDTQSARLESAQVSLPWAVAHLETNLALQYAPPFLKTNALFAINVDLARQPWVAAQGQLHGRLTIHPSRLAEFALSGRNIQAPRIHSPAVSIIGSLSNLAHRGTISFQSLTIPPLKPLDLALDWSGEKLDLKQVHTKLTAGRSAISAQGAANLKDKHFRLTDLAFGMNQIDCDVNVHWPNRAAIHLQVTNLTSGSFHDFIQLPYQEVCVDHVRLTAGWDDGPLLGDVAFAGRTILKDGTELGAQGALAANTQGLAITNLTLTRNHEPVSDAQGLLPVAIVVTNKNFAIPVPNQPFQLQATAHREAFFWKLLEKKAGVALREPDLRADLAGTWKEPRGRVSLRAAQLKFREAKPEVPPFDNLSLVAHIHEAAAEIEFFNFFVTDQPVTFSALMPLGKDFWIAPRKNARSLDWRNISSRLKIDSAQISAFVPLLPGMVVPQGTINADLGLVPGGNLDGTLRIDGASTRPIAGLGALQDIEILCRFTEGKAQVNSYVALGGYSVLGAGEAQLNANAILRGELPPFEFHLTGENVPLTRQVDAVIRADLDATLKHVPTQPVILSGKLNLRDSLYLRELRDLVPGRLASADRRPPYFSVETKPFADWRLNLAVAGHRFLKVRTPVFNGELSADFRLSGPLSDPVAIGDLTINAGLVRFPFGNIPVNQGLISLTSENPYRPQLFLIGNDRVLGYDINMEVSGYADAPVLQFSSTPPLSSEQILLMLTAGEIPRQGQFAFTPEERAQRLGFFLGRGVLSDFGIGADSNRLTIRSGENISDSGRPTYSVEYELTPIWSLIGQYDQFNDFNLMLKWRVYSK